MAIDSDESVRMSSDNRIIFRSSKYSITQKAPRSKNHVIDRYELLTTVITELTKPSLLREEKKYKHIDNTNLSLVDLVST